MATRNWAMQPLDVMNAGKVVPVLVFKKLEHAVPVAEALMEGGVNVLEITLRTECAVDAIELISQKLPEAITGAGTVINAQQLQAVENAGAKFAISPGLTPSLLEAANKSKTALIPGIATISELMVGIEHGYDCFKFFPAEANGGVNALKSIGGPFPDIRFCPTGGINLDNINNYLSLSSVVCCGGSWLVSDDIIKNKEWSKITELVKEALAAVNG